jgi:predicted AlkP superfamily phosphohydrolase/phosphomutase
LRNAVVALLLVLTACTHKPVRKTIVIGVDGMDPGFVEAHWSALPNLDRLRHRGGFTRLRTTTPPQSPVAWSTFITGLEPDRHGIYDFVHFDRATKQITSSTTEIRESPWQLPLGPYVLPLAAPQVISNRHGSPFWKASATVIRMPTNYPPAPIGHALSGMGTPDLRGTLGMFSFFTEANNHGVISIEGPPNTLRRDHAPTHASLTVDVDPERPIALLQIGNTRAILKQGEWSEWLPVDFPLIPLVSVRGMFRVYAKRLHPGFELYVSAIDADPLAPALPISYPGSFSKRIAQEAGRFYTTGTAQDTSALRQGVFTLPEFLEQTRWVLTDERRLFTYTLKHFEDGLLFFYFSSVDQNSHILWGKHDAELLRIYQAIDEAIGEATAAHPDADFVILSDHGFTTFDRAVNLNTWLFSQGWLALKGPTEIDWANTKAYAVGLNALYVFDPSLLDKITQELLAFRDPVNGRAVVKAVPRTAHGPDLIVGYAPGYRASWETGLGQTPRTILEDNNDAWIADHCINAADVPGVLFTSFPFPVANPGLADVTHILEK